MIDRSQFERKAKEADNQQRWQGRLQEERKERHKQRKLEDASVLDRQGPKEPNDESAVNQALRSKESVLTVPLPLACVFQHPRGWDRVTRGYGYHLCNILSA